MAEQNPSERKKHPSSAHSNLSLKAGLLVTVADITILEFFRVPLKESLLLSCFRLLLILVIIGAAFVGVKSGHRALHEITDRWGKVPGKKRAFIGLILCYPSLLLGMVMLIQVFTAYTPL